MTDDLTGLSGLRGQADALATQLRAPFGPADLEWRVQRSGIMKDAQGEAKVWATLTPFISARAVQDRLDAVLGIDGWEFRPEGWTVGKPGVLGVLRCRFPSGWVTKCDGAEQPAGGKEGQEVAVKGGFSNALKRAAVQFGVGRALYHAGTIYAEVSLTAQRGWDWAIAKDKKSNASLRYWWRVPPAALERLTGQKADDDVRRPAKPAPAPATPSDAPAPTPPAPVAPPSADLATPKQLAFLKNLLASSVWSPEERAEMDAATAGLARRPLSEQLNRLHGLLQERKRQAAPVAAGVLAGTPLAGEAEGELGELDDLPF